LLFIIIILLVTKVADNLETILYLNPEDNGKS